MHFYSGGWPARPDSSLKVISLVVATFKDEDKTKEKRVDSGNRVPS